ncbi:hypothetical protein ABZY83_34075 [Streptomyces virginiae]|uniref:DoxX family protein n=1 Tax=Streptomyces virginiae TaxID=1961 RepID=UPI0033A48764
MAEKYLSASILTLGRRLIRREPDLRDSKPDVVQIVVIRTILLRHAMPHTCTRPEHDGLTHQRRDHFFMFGTLMLVAVPAVLFRLLGEFGVGRFATWRVSVLHGLAVMLVFTASAHFAPSALGPVPGHHDLVAMVPSFVPLPRLAVYVTGVLELLGAAGLVKKSTRPVAGLGLAALFVLMLPANIHAALEHIPLNGEPATPLWFRIPEQVVFIGTALWAYVPTRAATADRSGGVPA